MDNRNSKLNRLVTSQAVIATNAAAFIGFIIIISRRLSIGAS